MRHPRKKINRADVRSALQSSRFLDPVRDRVFVSYSHQDRKWLERFQITLAPMIRKESLALWDDTQIRPGKVWESEIMNELSTAKVALMLVSPDFLASSFIADMELPKILKAAENDKLTIIWVLLSSCLYEETPIVKYQAGP